MGVVSVSIPEELLERIDEIAEGHDYSGRSEVVREAGRKLVSEFDERQLEEVDLAAVITVLYPYDSSAIETSLTELRHEYNDHITSNSHSCVGDHSGCIESFVLEGTLEDISSFVRGAEAVSEQIQVDHSLYPVEEIGKHSLQLR